MRNDLSRDAETRLRAALAHLETLAPAPPALPSPVGTSSRPLWRSPVVALAGFAAALLAGVPLFLWLRSTDSVTAQSTPTTHFEASTTTTSPPGEGGFPWPIGWSEAPGHSVTGRTFPIIVWTGSEYIVWGGEKPSEGEWHKSGAAFNPSLGRWRDLAPSPLTPRSEHAAVWTGTEVLICCGRQIGSLNSAGAYEPATDTWRVIAQPPISPRFAEAVWTGTEMIVFGGSGNSRGAAAYDPATDTWRTLADLPYRLERQAEAVLGDGVVYAWPSYVRRGDTVAPLAYDIESDSWRSLTIPESLDTPLAPSLIWTGDELIAWGLARSFESDYGVGLAFDPASGSWRALPPTPLAPTRPSDGSEASQAAVWTGSQAVIWTGWIGSEWDAPTTSILAYNPETTSWTDLDPAPVQGIGMWNHPLIWTGTQVVAYVSSADSVLIYRPDPQGTSSSADVSTTGTSGTSGNALAADLRIEGTRPPYTFEETQAYGEFGPVLWGLVTTLSGADEIPHGPAYEWVDWGPLWAGHQPDPGPYDVYGVTDLSAVDPDAIAAVVPIGSTIVLREVEWSLDQLEEFIELLIVGASENRVCSTGFGMTPNRVRVVALAPGPVLGDVPREALAIEIVDDCLVYVPAGTSLP